MKWVVVTLAIMTGACHKLCDTKDHEEAIKCLNSQPSRNLYTSRETVAYLNEHKVYISLTTSPDRLEKLDLMLRTLDLEHIEKIYLALPKLYRNKDPYPEIPVKLLEQFPKLEIIGRDQDDAGPIMKMLATVEKVNAMDPHALVISVDDDVGFPKGAINELIYHSVMHPSAIVSGWGNYAETYGILKEEWPHWGKAHKRPFCGSGEVSYCDTIEGWRAVAYKPRLVNTKRLRRIAGLNKACRTSDDLVISYVLAESGIEKVRIVNQFYPDIYRFESGTDAGALHKIQLDYGSWKPRSSIDSTFAGTTNSARYQRCVLDIRSQTVTPE